MSQGKSAEGGGHESRRGARGFGTIVASRAKPTNVLARGGGSAPIFWVTPEGQQGETWAVLAISTTRQQ